jgi:MFS family permease
VDRADKLRIVTACQALLLVLAGSLAVLVGSGVVAAWHVAVVASMVGLVNALEIPARQALIVELVGKEDLTNAIALNSSAFNATRIVGPAIAGILVAQVGLAVCFALNAASYVAVLAGLRLVRLPSRPPAPPAAGGVQRFLEGVRYVHGQPAVRALIGNTALLSLLGFPFIVLLPVFARDVLRVGPDGLGVMSAAVGIGALAAAFGIAALSPRVRRGRLVAVAGPLFGAAVLLFTVARSFALALLLLGLAGFAMVLNNAATNTLLQGLAPDHLRGRVMSLWTTVFVGLAPLGAVWAGWLAGRVGAPVAVGIGAGVAAAGSLWIWWVLVPELRSLR